MAPRVRGRGMYTRHSAGFRLYASPTVPSWRRPQLGALGAVLAHWSVRPDIPATVAIPTGVGKTAIAMALPFLASAQRTLVLVPSTDLRRQAEEAFSSQEILKKIGAFSGSRLPNIFAMKGLVHDWEILRPYDVVVALPNSASPTHYTVKPPQDLFDLVVVDEAHHAPAKTWQAVIEHFDRARSVLLTATPRRRDQRLLPGELVFHYPLRQALDEGIFKPVRADLLPVPDPVSRDAVDDLIADRVVALLGQPEHATSSVIIRASRIARANQLLEKYRRRGVNAGVLHSGVGLNLRTRRLADLRSGSLQAVAVVGMLSEGFDLPSLRILAYHDKYKSLPATAQILGRLARVDEAFPQPSILVTARDADVYPELRGVLRQLYEEEDADWAAILPGLIDDEIMEDEANRRFATSFATPPPSLALAAITPLRRLITYESVADLSWTPDYATTGEVPEDLKAGHTLRGSIVVYSGLSPDRGHLVVVSQATERPLWHDHPGLDTLRYNLHLVSYQRSRIATHPPLLLVNSEDGGVVRELVKIVDPQGRLRIADPTRVGELFDSLDRQSVSSVGVRNTAAGPGIPSYQTFAGKDVDHGIREGDVSSGALGHAIVQLQAGTAAGMSARKAKYWETRYAPLRLYADFVRAFATRYWVPPSSVAGQLLPMLSRPSRLVSWPTEPTIAVNLDYSLLESGWMVDGAVPVSDLSLSSTTVLGPPGGIPDRRAEGLLPLLIALPNGETVRAEQGLDGGIQALDPDPPVRMGYATPSTLCGLLSEFPPTVFFLDGSTIRGRLFYEGRRRLRGLPPLDYRELDWPDVNITAETSRTAARRGTGRSVQDFVFEYLHSRPPRAKHRWVLNNDGGGEFADCLLLEYDRTSGVHLELWHVKPSSNQTPGVRVTDMQVAVAQAIKGRHWLTDRDLWEELAGRLTGRRRPRLTVVHGNERELLALCGELPRWSKESLRARGPVVSGVMGIAQPGLSAGALRTALATTPNEQEAQVRDLLAVLHDAVSRSGLIALACSR